MAYSRYCKICNNYTPPFAMTQSGICCACAITQPKPVNFTPPPSPKYTTCAMCNAPISKSIIGLCTLCYNVFQTINPGLNIITAYKIAFGTSYNPDWEPIESTCKLCMTHDHDTKYHREERHKYETAIRDMEPESLYLKPGQSIIDCTWIDEAIAMGKGFTSPPHKIYGTVTARWIPQVDSYKCHFPANETLVALIRTKIPTNNRSYDPNDGHAWYISEPFFDTLLPILKGLFINCSFTVVSRAQVEEYSQGSAFSQVVSSDKLAEEFFILLERAGLQPDRKAVEKKVVKRDYLRAARHYHPDFNPQFAGDMSRLNELWATLTQEEVGYFK